MLGVRTRQSFIHGILVAVILAPYGINGMLVGYVSRDIDMNLLRENWEKNYPIRRIDGLPEFVEVTAGRLHSPSRQCAPNGYENVDSEIRQMGMFQLIILING